MPIPNLSRPVAEYAIRVRDANLNLVGELSAYERALFTLRYNGVSSWAIQLSASDPLAGALVADRAGIQVLRSLRDPATGALLSSAILFSGPRWGRARQLAGNSLLVSGYDDTLALAGRLAYQVVGYPYLTQVTGLAGNLRYYRLDEASGTTGVDSNSGAHNGTYSASGVTYRQPLLFDDGLGCVLWDGANNAFDVPLTGLPTGNAAWALETWFNAVAFPASGNATLINFGTSTANQAAAIKIDSTGKVFGDVFGSGTTKQAISTGVLYHAVVTWDGTTLKLYINGALAQTGTPGALNIVLSFAHIGGNGSVERFHGYQQGAAYYSAALTLAQVQANYALGPSRFVAAVADTRTGACETVLRQYVDKNAISAAADPSGLSRVVPFLALETDLGRGATVTGNGRMDQLVTADGTGLLQQLAQTGGLGFRVAQVGGALDFQVYAPSDKTATVLFSAALGNLADFTYQEDGPGFVSGGGNALMVAGGGQGTARVFVNRADTNSITRWNRFEQFADARDTTDLATLQQRGDAALAQMAATTQFALTLAPQKAIVYGADFGLGDTVTVIIDGVTYSDIVREVQIQLDRASAETVTPAVGSPNADTIRQLFGGFVQQAQIATLRSTASKLARSQ